MKVKKNGEIENTDSKHDALAELKILRQELLFAQKREKHCDEEAGAWLKSYIRQINRDILRNIEKIRDANLNMNKKFQI